MKTEFELYFVMKVIISSDYEGKKGLQTNTTVNDSKGTIPNSYNLYNNICTFVSPIYTFPWRKTKLFTRQIKVQIGKSTLIKLFIKAKCRLWREKNTLPSISSFTDRVFSIFRRKKYGSDPSEMDIKVVIPALTQ